MTKTIDNVNKDIKNLNFDNVNDMTQYNHYNKNNNNDKDRLKKYQITSSKNVFMSPVSTTKPLNTYHSPSFKHSVPSTQSPFSKFRNNAPVPPFNGKEEIKDYTNNNNNNNNNNNKNRQKDLENHKKMSMNKKKRRSVEDNNVVVANRFRLLKKLGKGSFGIAYKSLDLISNQEVALKLERQRENSSNREIQILERLSSSSRVPTLLWYGNFRQYKAMAIKLQGPNLCTLFDLNHKQFSLKSVTHIIIEILHCIKSVHSYGIVHRDIKPQNFIIGIKDPTKLYVIDFGLSSIYIDNNKHHVKYQENVSPVGTARYASLNNHRGIRQTRRDDLESIAYMIIYFLKGEVPWQGMRQDDRVKKWKSIEREKASISIHHLCHGLPHEFVYFLDYSKKLKYDQDPDYDTLVKVFRKLYVNSGFKDDYLFDWTTIDDDEDDSDINK